MVIEPLSDVLTEEFLKPGVFVRCLGCGRLILEHKMLAHLTQCVGASVTGILEEGGDRRRPSAERQE